VPGREEAPKDEALAAGVATRMQDVLVEKLPTGLPRSLNTVIAAAAIGSLAEAYGKGLPREQLDLAAPHGEALMPTPRTELEKQARDVAKAIDEALNENRHRGRVGFALFVFDFGEKGNLAYVSNAQRADMIAAVKEWLEKQEAGIFTDPEARA
jgi:hypothetical protein